MAGRTFKCAKCRITDDAAWAHPVEGVLLCDDCYDKWFDAQARQIPEGEDDDHG